MLESDELRLQGLVEKEIPRVDEIKEKVASDLASEQEALSNAESMLTRLLSELEMERSEVRATQQRITRVEEDSGNLNFYFLEARPPPNAMVMQALTQPYHIVKTKKVDLPVVFRSTAK